MDPQQRFLLEVSYRALENSMRQLLASSLRMINVLTGGIPLDKVSGTKTSVYTGCFTDDFKTLYHKDLDDSASYAATGITTTMNANRLSWFFNLIGNSVNIDTACSSSLVALDIACQGLLNRDCDMVGGSELLTVLVHYVQLIVLVCAEPCLWFQSNSCGRPDAHLVQYEHALAG